MRLELSLHLQQNFQEMIYILDSMEELKMRLLSDDYGRSKFIELIKQGKYAILQH